MLDKRRAAAMVVLLMGVGSVVGGVASLSAPGALIGAGAPVIALAVAGGRAKKATARDVERAMPEAFGALSIALGSGHSLAQAMRYVGVHSREPVRSEFMRVGFAIDCGFSATEALDGLITRLRAPGLDMVALALKVSQRTGRAAQGSAGRSGTAGGGPYRATADARREDIAGAYVCPPGSGYAGCDDRVSHLALQRFQKGRGDCIGSVLRAGGARSQCGCLAGYSKDHEGGVVMGGEWLVFCIALFFGERHMACERSERARFGTRGVQRVGACRAGGAGNEGRHRYRTQPY